MFSGDPAFIIYSYQHFSESIFPHDMGTGVILRNQLSFSQGELELIRTTRLAKNAVDKADEFCVRYINYEAAKKQQDYSYGSDTIAHTIHISHHPPRALWNNIQL
jgi:hypothetical protein